MLTLCLATVTAQAALLSRSGGQAYYDDVLDITWLADANLAASNSFGVTHICPDHSWCPGVGAMSWNTAQAWIGAMNTANYLGTNDWRLPTVTDTGGSGCSDYGYTGTDCGWNVDLSTGEMAHMYYSTLGNMPSRNTGGGLTGCGITGSIYCLTNTGPFSNLQRYAYWSGTIDADYPNSSAWDFGFDGGYQNTNNRSMGLYAWAVTDGDPFAVVPIPPAVYLFGSALGLMGVMRRKVKAS